MNPIDIEAMRRQDVIEALRYFAAPDRFHSLLERSTAFLKALLIFYREGGTDEEMFPTPGSVKVVIKHRSKNSIELLNAYPGDRVEITTA